jgi:hypothetical protein
MFNLNNLKNETVHNNRYEKRLAKLVARGQEIDRIKSVVETSILNLKRGQHSFVIYGEPQSGKTEMMIALTSKLLDEGYKIIIALLNDSVQLLGQNLERFQRSGLAPSPKKFNEILSPEIKIKDQQLVIFCKKNSSDLQKLIQKLGNKHQCVILDDEADYATPNSKINKSEKSKINELTGELIGKNGIYIGVTATPARLDLNKTHDNQNENWIDFPPHSNYTGQDIFFPIDIEHLPYRLTFLPDVGDDPKHLREALFGFMVNVAYLNSEVNNEEQNYSFLIHTSGKKADHVVDYKQVVKIFEAIKDDKNSNHKTYLKKIWDMAKTRYSGHENTITKYIIRNSDNNNIVVMNSDKEVNAADNRTATDPTSPFTITIGGNIVSRGVTFNSLLSMFFTRDVKHKLQQDTYIQRARMFGSRNNYLNYFELIIPRTLYLDWQKCFIFHRLSLEARKQNKKSPVWLDGERITAVSSSSIDNATVVVDRGEMSFELFDFQIDDINEILGIKSNSIIKLKAISALLGDPYLPSYLITYIESFLPQGDNSLAIHIPKSIKGYEDKPGEVDKATITRSRGFIGKRELENDKFPNAIHHINILYNEQKKARVFYKYEGNIRFLKTGRK